MLNQNTNQNNVLLYQNNALYLHQKRNTDTKQR
nr:MAG TPA: hypothetical protein [Caudoviricetes sp.]